MNHIPDIPDGTPHYAESGPLLFYGGWLSSFAQRPILLVPDYQTARILGEKEIVVYTCREEYYQASKAVSRTDHDWVLEARRTSTWKVKQRGQVVQLRDDWETVKYAVMLRCIWHELDRHELPPLLLATGDRFIGEDSPTDKVWGILNGGQNLLGLAWMHARAKLATPKADAIRQLEPYIRDDETKKLMEVGETIFAGAAPA